jgi:hypothetical protein
MLSSDLPKVQVAESTAATSGGWPKIGTFQNFGVNFPAAEGRWSQAEVGGRQPPKKFLETPALNNQKNFLFRKLLANFKVGGLGPARTWTWTTEAGNKNF